MKSYLILSVIYRLHPVQNMVGIIAFVLLCRKPGDYHPTWPAAAGRLRAPSSDPLPLCLGHIRPLAVSALFVLALRAYFFLFARFFFLSPLINALRTVALVHLSSLLPVLTVHCVFFLCCCSCKHRLVFRDAAAALKLLLRRFISGTARPF